MIIIDNHLPRHDMVDMVSSPQSNKLIGIAGKVLPTWTMAGPVPEEAMAVSGLAPKAMT